MFGIYIIVVVGYLFNKMNIINDTHNHSWILNILHVVAETILVLITSTEGNTTLSYYVKLPRLVY